LHTSGRRILDDANNPVRLTGINWFGLETSNFAPHGLWARPMADLLDVIDSLGYNVIRLPYCNQLFDSGSTPTGIDFNQNPDLFGLSGLEIMDKVIEGAGERGIRVILDRHRPDANAQSELWYTAAYPEQRWIDDWTMLAARYARNPAVIGADLHNEPHGSATWGSGNAATDWQLAAQRAGNAILSVNTSWLIVVEGIDTVQSSGYWWGGNLKGAAQHPVELDVAGRLVYSTHDYPATIFHHPWFDAPNYPNNLPDIWNDRWGYLLSSDTAPVLLGEFGTRYETESDRNWLQALASYIAANEMSFTFWCLNPNSGDTGGILMDDWVTVRQDKQDVLAPLLAPKVP
jgi:aryl-phospho-beta-D-glucosidase BglC (GH1 family)